MKALGMIETRGIVGCIEATDAMAKSANVVVLGMKEIDGGLVSVFVQGEVGAVRTAIDAGAAAAKKVGELHSVHMIARPSDDAMRVMPQFTPPQPSKKG